MRRSSCGEWLTHEFFLVINEFEFKDRYEWYSTDRHIWENKAVLSDDIILYMMDFLNWVPSFNPETKESGNGLNYYGITVIHNVGADKLISVLDKWLNLFDEAPDTFSLRGDTIWKEEDNGEGYWEQTINRMNRERMQSELNQLIGLAVKATNNNQLIIHFGI
ncbi:hypothetical protein [Paenibacillus lutimineralis]|uniref:Coagulation factor 5/8 type-like protein n=1 Tax=Paenibacillus lutimineralis TaxID=2707005 RepID=A0A3Q9IBJ9_9BACL|nr:hypothetical protein [Paenibacillus lutimineralis]AZS15425.1 hypothetical protein EI981_13785 [Paenibacillus lutimineralis]